MTDQQQPYQWTVGEALQALADLATSQARLAELSRRASELHRDLNDALQEAKDREERVWRKLRERAHLEPGAFAAASAETRAYLDGQGDKVMRLEDEVRAVLAALPDEGSPA